MSPSQKVFIKTTPTYISISVYMSIYYQYILSLVSFEISEAIDISRGETLCRFH